MAVNATDGLILNILISVKSGPNLLENLDFLKTRTWAEAQATADDHPLGQGLFKKVDQQSYETAQANLNAAPAGDVSDDSRVFTRSVERLVTDGDGTGPWDGGFPHPDLQLLQAWVSGLKG